jgi:3-hydroxybutyryl-CoA dehydrogenase
MTRPVIACIGAGRMGRGIAVAFAYAGHRVAIVDFKSRDSQAFEALADEALDEIRRTLLSLSRFGLLAPDNVERIMTRVQVMPEAEAAAALGGAAVIFEGVPEVLELKRNALARA